MDMIGDSTRLESVGAGDVELEAFDGTEWCQVVIKNVLHIPKMTFNLFSVTQMFDEGYVQQTVSNESVFITLDGNTTVAIAKRDGNLFRMMFRRETSSKCLLTVSIKTWHERLAPQNAKYVKNILKQNSIKFLNDWNDYVCSGCVYGK